MSLSLSAYDIEAAAAHRARLVRLRDAVALASQLADTLRDMEPRYAIRSVPAKDDTEQAVLDEIFSLEDAIDKKLRAVNEWRNLALSPSSRLNNDVLQMVFHDVCKWMDTSGYTLWSEQGIKLSHVCRRWRALALDTTTLWNEATFAISEGSFIADGHSHPWRKSTIKDPCLTSAERLKVFLGRSKGSALRTTLNLAVPRDLSSFVAKSFIEECSDRAESVSVILEPQETSSFLDCLSCVSRVVKMLDIHLLRQEASTNLDQLKRLYQIHLPSLKEVTLRDVPLPSVYEPDFISFQSVKVLSLVHEEDYLTLSTFTVVLRCCPDLEDLSLTLNAGLNSPIQNATFREATVQRVPMTRLKSYRVYVARNSSIVAFGTLLADKLEVLDISVSLSSFVNPDPDTQDGMERSMDMICGFLRHSSSTLRSLALSGIPPRLCPKVLALAPAITKLSYSHWFADMTGTNYWEAFVQAALPSRCGDPNDLLCPSLRELVYQGHYAEMDLSMFLQLISERRQPGPAFAHVQPIRRLELCDLVPQSDEGQGLEKQIGAVTDEFVILDWIYDKEEERWVKLMREHTGDGF